MKLFGSFPLWTSESPSGSAWSILQSLAFLVVTCLSTSEDDHQFELLPLLDQSLNLQPSKWDSSPPRQIFCPLRSDPSRLWVWHVLHRSLFQPALATIIVSAPLQELCSSPSNWLRILSSSVSSSGVLRSCHSCQTHSEFLPFFARCTFVTKPLSMWCLPSFAWASRHQCVFR